MIKDSLKLSAIFFAGFCISQIGFSESDNNHATAPAHRTASPSTADNEDPIIYGKWKFSDFVKAGQMVATANSGKKPEMLKLIKDLKLKIALNSPPEDFVAVTVPKDIKLSTLQEIMKNSSVKSLEPDSKSGSN